MTFSLQIWPLKNWRSLLHFTMFSNRIMDKQIRMQSFLAERPQYPDFVAELSTNNTSKLNIVWHRSLMEVRNACTILHAPYCLSFGFVLAANKSVARSLSRPGGVESCQGHSDGACLDKLHGTVS